MLDFVNVELAIRIKKVLEEAGCGVADEGLYRIETAGNGNREFHILTAPYIPPASDTAPFGRKNAKKPRGRVIGRLIFKDHSNVELGMGRLVWRFEVYGEDMLQQAMALQIILSIKLMMGVSHPEIEVVLSKQKHYYEYLIDDSTPPSFME